MDPMTFLARLAAQVPPQRVHVLSYFGVLAAAKARTECAGHQEQEPLAPDFFAALDHASPTSTTREDGLGRIATENVPRRLPGLPLRRTKPYAGGGGVDRPSDAG